MNLAFRFAAGGTGDGPKLPGSLHVNRRLGQWLQILPEGIVEARSVKVELGQGIATALAQIVADELDVALARVRMIPASTATSPDEAVTSGSLSVQESGTALRYACAEARSIYLEVAAARLGKPVAGLQVIDGEIVAVGGAHTSYWALADDALLDREATAGVAPKSTHRVVGAPVMRLDIPDKAFGRPRFVHDLEPPGMLHGRVLRPPSPAAALLSLDDAKARALEGIVAVVRDGDFVGVIAEREEVAA